MKIPPKIAKMPIIWELRKLSLYCVSLLKALYRFRSISIVFDSVIYFSVWWKYHQKNNDPLKNDFPWITFKAEQFIRKILRNDMIVFEYGSGSSTLYFSRRVAKVFSIEHHRGWHEHLCRTIEEQAIKNVDCRLIEPETIDEKGASEYLSQHFSYKNKDFTSYVKSIDAFPDGYFDLALIDGRSRSCCIAHAKNKVKPGGYLVIDNSDRAYYFNGNDFLWDEKEWKAYHFTGPIPYSFEFSKTSVFQKLHFH